MIVLLHTQIPCVICAFTKFFLSSPHCVDIKWEEIIQKMCVFQWYLANNALILVTALSDINITDLCRPLEILAKTECTRRLAEQNAHNIME